MAYDPEFLHRGYDLYNQQYEANADRQQELIKQQKDFDGKGRLQKQKGDIDTALQGQEIAGQQTLAYQKAGYEYGLQGQQQDFQGQQNKIKQLHDDELFEREQAGRLAEQHLGFIQQEKMANVQAGIQTQRDQSQFVHEAALADMAAKRQEARDEILERYKQGSLSQEHTWKAEALDKELKSDQQKIWDTHIAQGIQNGNLVLNKNDQDKLDQIDGWISDIDDNPNYNDVDKQKMKDDFGQQRMQVQRRAKPPSIKGLSPDAAIDKTMPSLRKTSPWLLPAVVFDTNGIPSIDRNIANSITKDRDRQLMEQEKKEKAQADLKEKSDKNDSAEADRWAAEVDRIHRDLDEEWKPVSQEEVERYKGEEKVPTPGWFSETTRKPNDAEIAKHMSEFRTKWRAQREQELIDAHKNARKSYFDQKGGGQNQPAGQQPPAQQVPKRFRYDPASGTLIPTQ